MYNVGNIVYIVSNKKRQVLPAQVVEQINRRTLAGEQIQYQVLIAGAPGPVDLDSLSAVGKIFSSLEEVRTSLQTQAEAAIAQVIEDASQLAGMHFATSDDIDAAGEIEEEQLAVSTASEDFMPKAKRLKVKMPDGTSASVSMPDV